MNSNSFLASLGLNPNDFCRIEGPFVDSDLIIYEAWEARKDAACPECGGKCNIHSRYTAEIKMQGTMLATQILIAHRIVYRCAKCGKTLTMPIGGAPTHGQFTYAEKAAMLAELRAGLTFTQVAKIHSASATEVVRVFDEAYPEVKGRRLPKILLVDEFKFKTDAGKYVCHLVDFEASETVDLIESRAKAYVDEYFSPKPDGERAAVKYVVTDMYDEYASMARKWLPNAVLVVDRFHVVKQLTEAVNSIRVAVMNELGKGTVGYAFMKARWKCFLCRKDEIPHKVYTKKSTGECWGYADLVHACVQSSYELKEAYYSLQEVLAIMKKKMTHGQALAEIDFISKKLSNCQNPRLKKVAATYSKWRESIAMGIAKNELGAVLTNAKMEAANNVAQTMIDAAYGYRNFARFRKRFLLLRWDSHALKKKKK